MSGIGSGHNKFITCAGCPDRTIEPNCHTSCRGYLVRMEKLKEEKERRRQLEQGGRLADDFTFGRMAKRKKKNDEYKKYR